ncbi:MAG: hypothetical protein J0I32_09130 [Sphingobacteriales bacterium]|nr:hypothetical protein [Sphingobacteriales bacterium]
MLVDRTLDGIRSKRRYSSTNSRDIPRSSDDRRVETHSYINNDTGSETTLVIFELPGAVSQREGFR